MLRLSHSDDRNGGSVQNFTCQGDSRRKTFHQYLTHVTTFTDPERGRIFYVVRLRQWAFHFVDYRIQSKGHATTAISYI